MTPELIFTDRNERVVADLRLAFEGCHQLTAVAMAPSDLPGYEMDAIFLTLTAAERWGSRPIPYKSQVLKTGVEDTGMPPYIVTGIALDPEDPRIRDPKAELEAVLLAVFDAIDSFNVGHDEPIRTVGFWTDALGIDRIEAFEAGKIIRSLYEARYLSAA